ncbi:hypothetical protein SLS56_007345 [Neofusicoccum ribis]|uniref:Uncharacterized protein n=1 Tax=Neofusicoccum ribis TaxID=45134 RepID=A0ABR3SNB1_9PEZI
MDSYDNDIVMPDSPNNGIANHSLADFYRARSDLCPLPRIDSMENNDQNSITSTVTDGATLPITGDAALSIVAEASDNAMHDLHQHRTAAFIATTTLEAYTGETDSISSGMRPNYADRVISDLTASMSLPSSAQHQPANTATAGSSKDFPSKCQPVASSHSSPEPAIGVHSTTDDWEINSTSSSLIPMHSPKASVSQAVNSVARPTATSSSGLTGKHLQAERAKNAKSHLDEARDMLNQTLISRNTAPILPPSLTSSTQQFRYLEGIKVSIVRSKAAMQREEQTLFKEMQEMVEEEVRDLEVVRVQSSSLGCPVSKGYLMGQWQAHEEIKDQLDCPSADALLEPIFSKLRIMLEECSEV